MRVLIVTGVFPPEIGGPATYVPALANYLTQQGHHVRVLAISDFKNLSADDSNFSFSVVRLNRDLPHWRRSAHFFRQALYWGKEADVILDNTGLPEAILANELLRKPYIVKVVGDGAWEQAVRRGWTKDDLDSFQSTGQRPVVEIAKRFRNWCLRRVDCILVPSLYLKRIVLGWGIPEDRCEVIYNAVSVPAIEPDEKTPPGSVRARLITVCRLVPWKGVDLLLRALARIDELELTVVGEGPCLEELQALAKELQVEARVNFVSAMEKKRLQAFLRSQDIFALVSSYEGLPHALLEALQAGLPVVATRVGGTPEVVIPEQNGILIEAGDVDALTSALRRLVTDGALRSRMGQAGTDRIRSHFSFEQMVHKTERLLLSY